VILLGKSLAKAREFFLFFTRCARAWPGVHAAAGRYSSSRRAPPRHHRRPGATATCRRFIRRSSSAGGWRSQTPVYISHVRPPQGHVRPSALYSAGHLDERWRYTNIPYKFNSQVASECTYLRYVHEQEFWTLLDGVVYIGNYMYTHASLSLL
jgi:hypothetical protein